MDSANGFGAKLLAVIFFVVATQCTGQSSPNSLQAPFSMSIDLDPNNLPAPGNSKIVLATQEFQLWLELTGRCSLSLRRQYSAPVARLVWTANYFTVSPDGADRCTLTFTKDGDLQLWVLYRQQTFMVWNSKTGGKGVTKMALETNPDRGEFKLLTPRNQAVFSSFAIKEFAILPTQKFWYVKSCSICTKVFSWTWQPASDKCHSEFTQFDNCRAGELLKSPDTVQEIQDQDRRILLNKGHYLLAINNGDLQLLLNGPKPLVYWSLKKSGLFKGDLSQVANAGTQSTTCWSNFWGFSKPRYFWILITIWNSCALQLWLILGREESVCSRRPGSLCGAQLSRLKDFLATPTSALITTATSGTITCTRGKSGLQHFRLWLVTAIFPTSVAITPFAPTPRLGQPNAGVQHIPRFRVSSEPLSICKYVAKKTFII